MSSTYHGNHSWLAQDVPALIEVSTGLAAIAETPPRGALSANINDPGRWPSAWAPQRRLRPSEANRPRRPARPRPVLTRAFPPFRPLPWRAQPSSLPLPSRAPVARICSWACGAFLVLSVIAPPNAAGRSKATRPQPRTCHRGQPEPRTSAPDARVGPAVPRVPSLLDNAVSQSSCARLCAVPTPPGSRQQEDYTSVDYMRSPLVGANSAGLHGARQYRSPRTMGTALDLCESGRGH